MRSRDRGGVAAMTDPRLQRVADALQDAQPFGYHEDVAFRALARDFLAMLDAATEEPNHERARTEVALAELTGDLSRLTDEWINQPQVHAALAYVHDQIVNVRLALKRQPPLGDRAAPRPVR